VRSNFMPQTSLKCCVEFSHHSWTTGDHAAPGKLIATARAADAAGIDSIWVSEDPDGWDAFAVLGSLSLQTSHARLGTGVTNPFHRHPNLIAASVSTLDQLSGGRAFLGLGRGQTEWYQRALGISTGNPLEGLEETIDLLTSWWTGDHRASSSGHFAVNDWERTVAPFERPPIYLAAAGPKALALAGRCADGVLFNELASIEFLEDAIGRVKRTAEEVNRDPATLSFFARTGIYVTDNPEPELERRKATVAMIHALPGMERLIETPGFDTEQIITEVRRVMKTDEVLARGGGFPKLRRSGDLEAARRLIPTALMAHLAVVGDLKFVKERLATLAEVGVTHVFIDRRQAGDAKLLSNICHP
jgi:5,10-methylenetetrahydromethanopterin reductase